jgi:hypothetical protein
MEKEFGERGIPPADSRLGRVPFLLPKTVSRRDSAKKKRTPQKVLLPDSFANGVALRLYGTRTTKETVTTSPLCLNCPHSL